MKIRPEAMEKDVFIHCPNKWQAEALCAALHEKGKKWWNGASYKYTNYEVFDKQTCYSAVLGVYGKCTYCVEIGKKIINFYDAVIMEDSTMHEETKYVWDAVEVGFKQMVDRIPPGKELNKFKIWCFDNTNGSVAPSISDLLKELHKPKRKQWAKYALAEGLIREVGETFQIGDVIRILTKHNTCLKYMIVSIGKCNIILIDQRGTFWGSPVTVYDPFLIKRSELSEHLGNYAMKFCKVGNGAQHLI